MNVIQRVKVEKVSYGGGEVEAYITSALIDETGRVVGTEPIRLVRFKEPDGNWGNKEVEKALRADVVVDQLPSPPLPATEAVIINGKEVRPALPEVPARPATWKKTFPDNTIFTWE